MAAAWHSYLPHAFLGGDHIPTLLHSWSPARGKESLAKGSPPRTSGHGRDSIRLANGMIEALSYPRQLRGPGSAVHGRLPCGEDEGQEVFGFFHLPRLRCPQAVNCGLDGAGCLPGWSDAWRGEGRGHSHTLPGQASLQKYFLREVQLHPAQHTVGNAQSYRELCVSTRSPHPRVPGRVEQLGKARGAGHPAPRGTLMLEDGEPSLRGWEAMGVWRGPSIVLALLLLLCPLPAPACPPACRCLAGDVDCRQRALHEVPPRLPTNASTLLLGYNFIAVLRARSFPSLPALLRLSLPHNQLGMIHRQALVGLGALQELDLSNNYLATLSPESFLPLGSLATLNLGNNRLEELGAGVLSALPQLQELFLHGNPWVCSCSILPLWRWLGHNRDKVPGECSESPPAPSSLVIPNTARPWVCGDGVPVGAARFPRSQPHLGGFVPGSGPWCHPPVAGGWFLVTSRDFLQRQTG